MGLPKGGPITILGLARRSEARTLLCGVPDELLKALQEV